MQGEYGHRYDAGIPGRAAGTLRLRVTEGAWRLGAEYGPATGVAPLHIIAVERRWQNINNRIVLTSTLQHGVAPLWTVRVQGGFEFTNKYQP